MKLVSARITNFRSVEDSESFRVAPVTCFVGKNESGKTSLLTALSRLNPYVPGDSKFDREKDYPRRYLNDYESRHPKGAAPVVESEWTLDPQEVEQLVTLFGPAASALEQVKVFRGFDADHPTWSIGIDEAGVVKHLIATSALLDEERAKLSFPPTIVGLKEKLTGIPTSERLQQFNSLLQTRFSQGTAVAAIADLLSTLMPKFLYFSQYQRMAGQVAVDPLIHKKNTNTLMPEDRVFLALCDLAGTTVEGVQSINKFETLVAKFEAASIKISREIFTYWSQNRHLKVQFRFDQGQPGDAPPFNVGKIFRTRIYNSHHEVTVPFDERSAGFVWFFSFIALFSQVKKTHGDNVVILLDEPGLSLHAKAQADLLRYIHERLAPKHQVLYTTHSPFMVPPDDLLSVRTVEDVIHEDTSGNTEILGTKVGSDVLSTDRDTLFPLQGALGYEISQSLFVGEHTLVVEGPSDLLYLRSFSETLKEKKRTSLDARWVICPAGGLDKVPAFMSLFGGNKLHVAVFVDLAAGQKKKVEELRRSSLLREGHVLTADTYAGQGEADIEDLLGVPAYLRLVESTYNLPANKLVPPQPGVRVLKSVEDQFKLLSPHTAEFDHFTPSAYLIEHRKALSGSLDLWEDAFNRFERLFKDLNGLLTSR